MKEQIEEMALIICGFKDCTSCISRMGLRKCGAKAYAERFYNAGYRKQSEVERLRKINSLLTEAGQEWQKRYENLARDIFEEIDLIFRKHYDISSESSELKLLEPIRQCERFIINEMWHDIAELKKKYTEV